MAEKPERIARALSTPALVALRSPRKFGPQWAKSGAAQELFIRGLILEPSGSRNLAAPLTALGEKVLRAANALRLAKASE